MSVMGVCFFLFEIRTDYSTFGEVCQMGGGALRKKESPLSRALFDNRNRNGLPTVVAERIGYLIDHIVDRDGDDDSGNDADNDTNDDADQRALPAGLRL